MHIVLLHQYHHNPDCPAMCRHYDFTARWARNHRVTIIGSDAWESKRITTDYPWVPEGVDLVSVRVPYDNQMSTRRRLVAFASYARKAYAAAMALKDVDVVVGTSTPLSVAWAARRVARKLGVPFVFEVRDLWPDFPIEMGAISNPLAQKWLRGKESELYRSADHVVTLSPDMSDHVLSKGALERQVSTILQGSDVERAGLARESDVAGRLRNEFDLGDARVLLYAGAFGRANDIPTLLAAARQMIDHTDVVFAFVGHGYYTDLIASEARRLPNVRLVAPVPRHAVFDWFATASLALVSFVDVPSVAASSPSKLFDAMATGCPVVVTNPGWTKELVEKDGCGWYTPAGDPDQMASALQNILDDQDLLERAGENAVRVARERFDRNSLADTFENILLETVSQHSARLQAS